MCFGKGDDSGSKVVVVVVGVVAVVVMIAMGSVVGDGGF